MYQNDKQYMSSQSSVQENWADQEHVVCGGERYDEMPTPEVLRKDYRFLGILGEGANGKTYLGVSRLEQTVVAIKALKLVDDFKSLDLFKREAQTLSQVQVNGVPKFLGFVSSQDEINEYYIIQEYIEYPSLQHWIDLYAENGKTLSEAVVLHIMSKLTDILYALQTAYSPPIIHRDIKPSNILFDDKTGDVKLIDFGAVANPAKKSGGSTVAGTQGFMAPEQLMGECTIQSDFYAMGATMLYMLLGISPVDMEMDSENPFLILCEEPLKKHGISQPLIDLIRDLLSPQCEKRPTNAMELKERIEIVAKGKADVQIKRKPLPAWIQNGRLRLIILSLICVCMVAGCLVLVILYGESIVDWLTPIEQYVSKKTGKIGYRLSSPLNFFGLIGIWVAFIIFGFGFSHFILPYFFKRSAGYRLQIQKKGRFGATLASKKKLQDLERKSYTASKMADCGENLYKIRPVYKKVFPGHDLYLYEYVYSHNGAFYYYYGRAQEGEIVALEKGLVRTVKSMKKNKKCT